MKDETGDDYYYDNPVTEVNVHNRRVPSVHILLSSTHGDNNKYDPGEDLSVEIVSDKYDSEC